MLTKAPTPCRIPFRLSSECIILCSSRGGYISLKTGVCLITWYESRLTHTRFIHPRDNRAVLPEGTFTQYNIPALFFNQTHTGLFWLAGNNRYLSNKTNVLAYKALSEDALYI